MYGRNFMKRNLISLLSLVLIAFQVEDAELTILSDRIQNYLLASEELPASEAIFEPMIESTPFPISEREPLIPNDAAPIGQAEDDYTIDPDLDALLTPEETFPELDEQLTILLSDESEMTELFTKVPAPIHFSVKCCSTKTILTYIFTPIITPSQETTP
jgi:hypothetical protein